MIECIGVMEQYFNHYQILISKLVLPERQFPADIVVGCVRGQREYEIVLALFQKIFPDEIDTEKAAELHDLKVQSVEGHFIAKIDQKIVGFLITGIVNQVSYISYLGVLQDYRGQGVATALLQEYKAYLNEKNVEKIRCTIRKDNKKTLGYIQYLGFQLL